MTNVTSIATTAAVRGKARGWVVRGQLFCGVCAALLAYPDTARARNGNPIEPPEALIRTDYWSDGRPRLFASSRLEGGLVFAKPQVAVGYGQPFWTWVGIEAYALTTNAVGAGYVGIRGALPFANVSFGVRDSYSYIRSFLPIKTHYTADDVSSPTGDHARYLTVEAEAFGVFPAPGGYALLAPALYAVTDAPPNRYLYEESLRGVMEPPFIWALRFGYVLAFGHDEFAKAGALVEIVGLPGRGEAIVRAGPAATVALTNQLDLTGVFSMVLSSPDSLGLWHGPFGEIGFRYCFASR